MQIIYSVLVMTGILAGLVIMVLGATMILYNSLIKLKNNADEAWSNIEVLLNRRYDLIAPLTAAVKGYAGHEKEVFEKVAALRSKAMSASSVSEQNEAEDMLTDALKTLFAVVEGYPDLKANENFMKLQAELADTENRIQWARNDYNGCVREYNTAIESFPTNIVASRFNLYEKPYFDVHRQEVLQPTIVDFSA